MGTAISRGRIGAGTPMGTPTGTPTGTPALTGWPGDPGFPGRPGLPGTPSVPGNPCGGKKGHGSATGVPRSADPVPPPHCTPSRGVMGQRGSPSPDKFGGEAGGAGRCPWGPGPCAWGRQAVGLVGSLTLSPFFPGCSTLSPGGPRGPTGPGGPGSPWRPWDSRGDRLGGRWWPRDTCPLHPCTLSPAPPRRTLPALQEGPAAPAAPVETNPAISILRGLPRAGFGGTKPPPSCRGVPRNTYRLSRVPFIAL